MGFARFIVGQPGGSDRFEIGRVRQWHPPQVNDRILGSVGATLQKESFLHSTLIIIIEAHFFLLVKKSIFCQFFLFFKVKVDHNFGFKVKFVEILVFQGQNLFKFRFSGQILSKF